MQRVEVEVVAVEAEEEGDHRQVHLPVFQAPLKIFPLEALQMLSRAFWVGVVPPGSQGNQANQEAQVAVLSFRCLYHSRQLHTEEAASKTC